MPTTTKQTKVPEHKVDIPNPTDEELKYVILKAGEKVSIFREKSELKEALLRASTTGHNKLVAAVYDSKLSDEKKIELLNAFIQPEYTDYDVSNREKPLLKSLGEVPFNNIKVRIFLDDKAAEDEFNRSDLETYRFLKEALDCDFVEDAEVLFAKYQAGEYANPARTIAEGEATLTAALESELKR